MANAGNMGQFGGYGNVDSYAQQQGQGMPMDGYMNPDMQNGMYNPQMGAMPNQQYADPMQQPYGGQPQGGMYYPQGQPPVDRSSHHAEIRNTSIYGPKELHSPKIAEVERANNAAAAAPAAGMAPMGNISAATAPQVQPAAAPAMQPTMQPQAAPQPTQSYQPQAPMAAPQAQAPMAQAAAPAAAVAQPQMQPGAYQMGAQMGVPPKKNGGATLSLILGLFSIIFGLIPPIGIALGIIARSVAKGYKKRGGKADRALAGKIFGTIGLIFSIGMLVFIGVCAALMFGQIAGAQTARDMLIYYNNSPLGQLGTFALPTV